MKHAILTISLLVTFAGPVLAAPSPMAEDPNDISSASGRNYQTLKKKLGGCAATAQGNASENYFIHADATTINTPDNSAVARALRSNGTI